jgi:uncharacterized protein YbjT (DUF2867 family)
MYFVAGITGQTGSSAAEALLQAGHRVRALVRNKAKAASWAARGVEIVEGDITDKAALTRALADVTGAYLLAPPHVTHPDPIAYYRDLTMTIREAAQAASLKKLVFLSSQSAHLPTGTDPIRGLYEAERILAGAAPELTFLRPAYFHENWKSVFSLAVQKGILPTMFTDPAHPITTVATADIGRVAADLLLAPDAAAVIELEGPEPLSADDAAAVASAALGKPVSVVVLPRDQWIPVLTGAGLGEAYAGLLAELYDGINSGHIRFAGDVPLLKGRFSLRDTMSQWSSAAAA